jgi:hypothetical protein
MSDEPILVPVAMERAILYNLLCSKCKDYAAWVSPTNTLYCLKHTLP